MKKIGCILLLLILASASPALAGKKEIKPCNIGVNPVGPAHLLQGEDLIETDRSLVVVMGDRSGNIITCLLPEKSKVVFKDNIATRIYNCSNPIYNRIVWKEASQQQTPAPQQMQKQLVPAPVQAPVPVKEEFPLAIKQALEEERPVRVVAVAKTGEKPCFGKSTVIIGGSSVMGGIGLALIHHPVGWVLIGLGVAGDIIGFSKNDSNLACEIAALPIGVAGGYGLGKLGEKIFETHPKNPSHPSAPSTGGDGSSIGGGSSTPPAAPTGPSTPPAPIEGPSIQPPAPYAPASL